MASNVMHNKMTIARWILVIPSAFVGWYLALFIGLVLYSVTDSICPPELIDSGMCMATWSRPVKDGIIIFSASLSAILVLLFAVFIAPCKRAHVAKIIYLGGFAFALYAVYQTKAYGSFFSAIISGALFLLLLLHYLEGKNSV